MQYTLEYLSNGSLESEDGEITSDSELEHLILKLDAEKYVSLVLIHKNANILTISGGRQQYIVLFADLIKMYELTNPINRGNPSISLRTGHTIGKFPAEMVIDTFTTYNLSKEFLHTGLRSQDLNWKPLS